MASKQDMLNGIAALVVWYIDDRADGDLLETDQTDALAKEIWDYLQSKIPEMRTIA